MSSPSARREGTLRRWAPWVLGHLQALWGVPLIDASVSYSSRMTRNLGRCYLERADIRLNPRLGLRDHRPLLRETLVHEAAHLAAWRLGQRGRPHGGLWPQLMHRAGFLPRATIDPGPSWPRRQPRVRLTCMDCGEVTLRSRSDHRWRCRRCHRQGRGGLLRVEVFAA